MKVTDNRKNGNKTFGELPVGAVVSLNIGAICGLCQKNITAHTILIMAWGIYEGGTIA